MTNIFKALGILGLLLLIVGIWTFPSEEVWAKLIWTSGVILTVAVLGWTTTTDL